MTHVFLIRGETDDGKYVEESLIVLPGDYGVVTTHHSFARILWDRSESDLPLCDCDFCRDQRLRVM